MSEQTGSARSSAVHFPAAGAVRIHPEPAALPRLRHEGPGRNRFDDPAGAFVVRYAADTMHGCLIETLSRFRPHPDTEALLAAIDGINDEDEGELGYLQPGDGVAEWLAAQRVGLVQITSPAPLLVDVENVALLDSLDKHPAVRVALDTSGLGTPLDPVHLDSGIIRLGGPIGRPITQAVSRAIYEWTAAADGIGYRSRLDPAEHCWAVFGHVPVSVTITDLDPADPDTRSAVQAVAARFEITLPSAWT